jgi:hypothetical protein
MYERSDPTQRMYPIDWFLLLLARLRIDRLELKAGNQRKNLNWIRADGWIRTLAPSARVPT